MGYRHSRHGCESPANGPSSSESFILDDSNSYLKETVRKLQKGENEQAEGLVQEGKIHKDEAVCAHEKPHPPSFS